MPVFPGRLMLKLVRREARTGVKRPRLSLRALDSTLLLVCSTSCAEYLTADSQLIDLRDSGQLPDLHPGQLVELSGEYLGNPLENILGFMAAMFPYYEEQIAAQKAVATDALDQAKKAQRSGNPSKRTAAQAQESAPDTVAMLATVSQSNLKSLQATRVFS